MCRQHTHCLSVIGLLVLFSSANGQAFAYERNVFSSMDGEYRHMSQEELSTATSLLEDRHGRFWLVAFLSHGNIKITDDNRTKKSGDILRINQKVLIGADRNVGTTFFLDCAYRSGARNAARQGLSLIHI